MWISTFWNGGLSGTILAGSPSYLHANHGRNIVAVYLCICNSCLCNIMQIVWLVIPGVGPGYRGAGPWPGVGVPQQRRASVAAVAVARP